MLKFIKIHIISYDFITFVKKKAILSLDTKRLNIFRSFSQVPVDQEIARIKNMSVANSQLVSYISCFYFFIAIYDML